MTKKEIINKELWENSIKFERMNKYSEAQRQESRVAYAPRLDNNRFRDFRDNQTLKRLTGRNMRNWEGLNVNEIHSLRKPKITGYWKYCDEMSAKGGIPLVRHFDGIYTVDLDARIAEAHK